ncbi:uncharacterized protein (DUF1501 family) [Neorhizobium sp. R1-B]|uniref:DUF1501 domain-containing protein n=1 Tax=unclassified Neorhizobium TaxID=2629175 RepID=UPI000DD57224|nr:MULTISPECIES: DUF1501 domain-containing protein [unclassified Neorhizobium]TCV63648.1 uncharacterized protein (DUF1501 family) [Neorhizobium sp. S3-V5DH]TDX75079.1 uncharacterized protein (DUF1501 family) [Neorhizobium sp. R1-B]
MTLQQNFLLSRRGFLAGACCAAAAPILTPVTLAATPGDNRFVTIVLRGAMDGLDLVQPYGDPAFATLRPKLGLTPQTGLLDLDGFFGLNPAASALMPLWQAGELSFVHAVSTPYRDQRSHFDGQDMLETGGSDKAERTGWLNRALSAIPRSDARKAIDINTSMELILSGPSDVDSWSTQSNFALAEDEIAFLDRLYEGDEAFARAMQEAKKTDMSADALYGDAKRGSGIAEMARLAGGMLREDYRIASFSINGWDTHVGQKAQFRKAAGDLSTAITTLKASLGDEAWGKTVVLAITEFGRTVRENGTNGTDHGTGGLAVLAGGAISGGKVLGQWPGLGDDHLLDRRDLMPTGDVREIAAAMLYRQFGIDPDNLTGKVFPGLAFDRSSIYLKG